MKNRSIEKMKSKVKIAVKGKNVNRFLLRVHKKRIPILNIEKSNKDELYMLIYFKDYERLTKLNTIYDIYIISYGGWENNKRQINRNYLLIMGILVSLVIVTILSKMIFKIEVVTNDNKMKDKLLYELKQYDIEAFKFQKSYNQIQKVKEEIIKKYKEEIEWFEIEVVGTKYIVRYEPRIINNREDLNTPRHIVAKKNAIIYSVISSKGQVVKYKNDYVKKGDIVVSGEIKLNDEIKDIVSAEGKIYGETWYEVEIFYPFGYYEQKRTGNTKNVYVIKFLNWRLELFNFNKFYDKIIKENIILSNRVLPFSLIKEEQVEVITKSSINTIELAREKALTLSIEKMKNKLDDNEHIIKYTVINEKIENDGINLKIFFSVCEDITDYKEIEEELDE